MLFTSSSVEETEGFARDLAKKYQDGAILAFTGELGAGKTTFIQGFAKGLRIKDKPISPTFVIIKQYDIPGYPMGQLVHIDLYRLPNIEAIKSLGLEEIFANPQNIVLIEWAEKLKELTPKHAVKVDIKVLSLTKREIQIED